MKNLSQLKIGTLLGVLAMACVCAVAFLGLGRWGGGSITQAAPQCLEQLICPDGWVQWPWPDCECHPDPPPSGTQEPIPTPTPTPTPFLYGPKGIGDDWHLWATPNPGTNLDALDFDWYYDWRVNYLPERGSDPRYVRMVYCTGTSGIVAAASEDYNNGRRGRVWLVYNEPDHSGLCGGNRLNPPSGPRIVDDPVGAAHHFSDVYDLIKGADPHARVFGGGLVFLNAQQTRNWWQTFIATLQADGNLNKLEGVHIHLYPLTSTSSNPPPQSDCGCNNASDGYCVPDLAQVGNQWYQDMHIGLGLGDKPIWITEMGWLECFNECRSGITKDSEWIRDHIMAPISQWFAGDPAWPYDPQVGLNPGYETVAWYVTRDVNVYPCSYLLDSLGPNGAPTELGEFWNGYQP